MAEKAVDYKKEFKELYLPATKPAFVTVPPMVFAMVDGEGSPDGERYQKAIGVLYAISFTIKMSKMGSQKPEGYFEYSVPPLEGLWDVVPGTPGKPREAWTWTSMIRQPEFVTGEVFAWALETAAKKKPELDFSGVRREVLEEGLCAQLMHNGPFATEAASVEKLAEFVRKNGCEEDFASGRRHHEIYLSDFRRTAPEKLKTVLRHPVKRK